MEYNFNFNFQKDNFRYDGYIFIVQNNNLNFILERTNLITKETRIVNEEYEDELRTILERFQYQQITHAMFHSISMLIQQMIFEQGDNNANKNFY